MPISDRTALCVAVALRDKIKLAAINASADEQRHISMGEWLDRAVDAQAKREASARGKGN